MPAWHPSQHGCSYHNSVSKWLRSEDIVQHIIFRLSPVAILFFASKQNSSRMPSRHLPYSDSGMVQDDESTSKVCNDAQHALAGYGHLASGLILCMVNRDDRVQGCPARLFARDTIQFSSNSDVFTHKGKTNNNSIFVYVA